MDCLRRFSIACRRGFLRKVCCFVMPWGRLLSINQLRHWKYELRTLYLDPLILRVAAYSWYLTVLDHGPYRMRWQTFRWCGRGREKSWQYALLWGPPQLAPAEHQMSYKGDDIHTLPRILIHPLHTPFQILIHPVPNSTSLRVNHATFSSYVKYLKL